MFPKSRSAIADSLKLICVRFMVLKIRHGERVLGLTSLRRNQVRTIFLVLRTWEDMHTGVPKEGYVPLDVDEGIVHI